MQLFLTSEEGNVSCVACEGDISQLGFGSQPDPLGDLLGADGYRRTVVLDLGQAGFIDSSGVGWLLTCHKRFRAAGGRLILHSVPPLVEQVLQLLRLNTVLTIQPDRAAALALAAKGSA